VALHISFFNFVENLSLDPELVEVATARSIEKPTGFRIDGTIVSSLRISNVKNVLVGH